MYRGCFPIESVKNSSGMIAQSSSRQSASASFSVRFRAPARPSTTKADEEERPRQQAAEQDGKIEPERPRVVEALGRETLEVVRDEEALKIRVAVLEPHRDVPRQPDDRGSQRRPRAIPRIIEAQTPPLAPRDWQQHDGRHDERDGPLHQEASAAPAPASTHHFVAGPEGPALRSLATSMARSAAQIVSVMQKVSGRSGSAARAIAK